MDYDGTTVVAAGIGRLGQLASGSKLADCLALIAAQLHLFTTTILVSSRIGSKL